VFFSKEISEILGLPPVVTPKEKPVTPKETPIAPKEVGGFAPGPKRWSVIDLDRMYSTDELKSLANQRGVSASGDKKAIASRLLDSGFTPSGESPAQKEYPKITYRPTPGITFGFSGGERSV